jgi:NAD-dependent DNA ligase
LSQNKLYDERAAEIFADNINMMVPWYLMAAYAYYEQDDPILSDSFFDDLAKTLLAVWDDVEHRHKPYITVDMLNAGTYVGKYPGIVEGAVKELRIINK